MADNVTRLTRRAWLEREIESLPEDAVVYVFFSSRSEDRTGYRMQCPHGQTRSDAQGILYEMEWAKLRMLQEDTDGEEG